MAGSDRSWTIAPTLLWFAGCLVAALCVLDGGLAAIADRFTARGARRASEAAPAPGAGPGFTAAPTEVAEASADEPAAPARAPIGTDRGKILALEDVCV